MSQQPDSKSTIAPAAATKANQPTLTELSPDELAKVSGGTSNIKLSDITITKTVDKSSPSL